MGLSVAISGAIILSVMMLIVLSMPDVFEKVFSIGEVSSEISSIEESLLRTDLSMDSLAAVSGSPRINFTLNNDGQEKLWNFEKFDLIITYDGISGRSTEPLSYSGQCMGASPSVLNWCLQGISGDILDPGILNNGEGASIRTQISDDLSSGIVIVLVVSDNGVPTTLSTTT